MSRSSDAPESWKSRAIWWVTFLGIVVAYAYYVPYFSALNNPNENSRVYQIRAYVELGKLSVDEQVRRYGWVNDLAKREGKLYAGKAPGTTFLGVPIYAALRWFDQARGAPEPSWFRIVYVLRLFGVILPCLLFVYLFRDFVRRVVGERVADMMAIVLALGTMMLPYGLLFVNHSLSAATSFGVVMAVERARRVRSGRWRGVLVWIWFAVAGFLLAATTALDYALFPVSVMLLGFVFWRAGWSWGSVVGTCLGASIPSLLTAAYHQSCWGSPFAVSMSFLANPQFAAEASRGMFGVVGPTAESVWGVLGSAKKGLIYFSPVFLPGLLAVVGAALFSRRSKEAALALAVVLWMLLYNVSLINWDAGWTVGPRYVTAIVPFVLFSLALLLAEMSARARGWVLAVVAGLGISSVAVVVSTSTMFPHLQPEYANPVFESIWPLWRDGLTPWSVGGWAAGLSGRWAQAPMVLVVTGLVIGMLATVGMSAHPLDRSRWRWARGVGAVSIAVLVACGTLWLQSVPRTEDTKRAENGSQWLRTRVWEPTPFNLGHRKTPRR